MRTSTTCCVMPTTGPTSVCATTAMLGFADTNFGGKLVGILNTLVSVFASSIVEFCDDGTATPLPASTLLGDYNIHINMTAAGCAY